MNQRFLHAPHHGFRTMKNILNVTVLCLTITACAGSFRRAEPLDFSLSVTDRLAERQYDVVLTSAAAVPLCLSKEGWPGPDGTFLTGYEGAILTTTAGPIHPKNVLTAFCPDGCGEVRLEPGQTLRGNITYAAFGSADDIAEDSARSLSFTVYPYYCRRSARLHIGDRP